MLLVVQSVGRWHVHVPQLLPVLNSWQVVWPYRLIVFQQQISQHLLHNHKLSPNPMFALDKKDPTTTDSIVNADSDSDAILPLLCQTERARERFSSCP